MVEMPKDMADEMPFVEVEIDVVDDIDITLV